jgi:hypothetical protein
MAAALFVGTLLLITTLVFRAMIMWMQIIRGFWGVFRILTGG